MEGGRILINGIQHLFFGAFLGIWAGFVLRKELPLWGYFFYALLGIGFASILVIILSKAFYYRSKGVSMPRVYILAILGSFLVVTALYFFQDILLPKEYHSSPVQLFLICPIIFFWLLSGDLLGR